MKTKEELNVMPVELNENDMKQVTGGAEPTVEISKGADITINTPGNIPGGCEPVISSPSEEVINKPEVGSGTQKATGGNSGYGC